MPDARNRRRFDRVRGRLSCRIRLGDESHAAFATDLSASGLFLQTRSHLPPGTKLSVELEADGGRTLLLTGRIARLQNAHRATSSLRQPGLGFAVEAAPEDYFQLVMSIYGDR